MLGKVQLSRRLADAFTMFMVSAACLTLLIFVAHGTVKRIYEQLLIDKLVVQSQLVQGVMEAYLRPGLPLRQFAGFNQLAVPMLKSDPMLKSMTVRDVDGGQVFAVGDAGQPDASAVSDTVISAGTARLLTSDRVWQVKLPLRNKFESVGDVTVSMDRLSVDKRIKDGFWPLLLLGALASIGLGLAAAVMTEAEPQRRRRRTALLFAAAYVALAAAVVWTMIAMFTDGVQSKGRALADSLGQRIEDIPRYGIDLSLIDGLGDVLAEYKRLNKDIASATIIADGRVAVHSEPDQIGRTWVSDSQHYEYRAVLSGRGNGAPVEIIISVPKSLLFWQVLRNVKNFAALFVASALFAFLAMQAAQATQHAWERYGAQSTDWRRHAALDLVKPVFFLAVVVEHLSYAFLPQFMTSIVAKTGLPSGYVAAPFAAYYLCFALALVPAGRLEQRLGARLLILIGLALSGLGLLLIASLPHFHPIVVARAMSGIGQGVLFIGVQSFILQYSTRENRTRANYIVVFGFQAGMISGMAIGSLLVGQIMAQGIFMLGGLIAIAVIAYAAAMLPSETAAESSARGAAPIGRIWNDIVCIMRDNQFVCTILSIGIPAKAALTGIVLFAIPILLHRQGFAQEDIGQITMIYAACVIIAGSRVSDFVDRTGSTRNILLWGVLLTAAGLITISALGNIAVASSTMAPVLVPIMAVAGIAMVGLAHGLINAPVLTHVTETDVAGELGAAPVAAVYRLLERSGHMIGPILIGQLFIVLGETPVVLAWVGIGILALGLLFVMPLKLIPPGQREEPAR